LTADAEQLIDEEVSDPSRRRVVFRAVLRVVSLTAAGLAVLFFGLGVWAYYEFRSDLPTNLGVVTDYRPLRASQIFSADGEMIGESSSRSGSWCPSRRCPRW
jgi:membrane carboxypeptidase/penicillin-binding protein